MKERVRGKFFFALAFLGFIVISLGGRDGTWGGGPYPKASLAVGVLLLIVSFLFVRDFFKTENRIQCLGCKMNFGAWSHWICGDCTGKNTVSRVLNRCGICSQTPLAIVCPHCNEVRAISGNDTSRPALICLPGKEPIRPIDKALKEHNEMLQRNRFRIERVQSDALVADAEDAAAHYCNRERSKRIAEHYQIISQLRKTQQMCKAIAETTLTIPEQERREAEKIVAEIEAVFSTVPDLYRARNETLQKLAEMVERGEINKQGLKLLTNNINDFVAGHLSNSLTYKRSNNDGL